MRLFLTISSLIILSSCSTPIVQHPIEVNREISSLTDCTDMVLGFFKQDPVAQRLKRNNPDTFEDFKSFIEFKDVSNRTLELDDQKKVINTTFFRKIGEPEELKAQLEKYSGKKISTIPFNEIIANILVKKTAKSKNVDDIPSIATMLVELKIPKEMSDKVFANSYWVKNGILPDLNIKNALNLDDYVVSILSQSARDAHDDISLIEVIDNLKFLGMNTDVLLKVIGESPAYQKLMESDSRVEEVIISSFKGYLHDYNYVYDNLKVALNIVGSTDASDLKYFLDKVNSNYSFFKAMENILLIKKDDTELYKRLSSSPYCQSMGISLEDIKSAITLASAEEKSFSDYMMDSFPIFKTRGKKSFFTFDYVDKQLETVEVKNQCGWGSCWMHASIEKMEMDMFYEKGDKVPLSVDFNYMRYIADEYKMSLSVEGGEPTEGGYSSRVAYYAEKWGVIPSSVWKPKNPFHDHENSHALRSFFIEVVENFKKEKFKNESEKALKIAQYSKVIDDMVTEIFGTPPAKFTYKDKVYTPQSFYKEFYSNASQPIKRIGLKNGYSGEKLPEFYVIEDGIILSKDLKETEKTEMSLEEISKIIIKSIDQKRSVRLETIWPNLSKDSYKSHNSTVGFVDTTTGKLTAPSGETRSFKSSGHAVLITGYELDTKGNLKSLKILNSWGTKSGDKGFYQMDMNFFQSFMLQIYVNATNGLGYVDGMNYIVSK